LVGPRAGLNAVKRKKFLPLPGVKHWSFSW